MNENERFMLDLITQNVFEIDDLGRIWRLKERKSRYNDYRLLPEKRRAESVNSGYLELHVSHKGKKYRAKAHRVVWAYSCGDIDDSLTINHLDANRMNNCLDNLELISVRDNLLHAHKLGLISGASPGEKHPLSVLSEKDVIEILNLYGTGKFTQSKLSERFGVSQSQIGKIVRGERWGHVRHKREFSRYGAAKLSPEDVRLIRQRKKSGAIIKDLAQEFNISLVQVERIVAGQAWKHIK